MTDIDKIITDLTEITPVISDVIHVVDVSDTTDNVSGSSKKTTFQKIQDLLEPLILTAAKIKTALGITTLSGDNTGDETNGTIKTKLSTDLPTEATGAELNTGTNQTKYASAKALADSDYAKTTDITVTADSTTTFNNKDLTSLTNSIYGNSLYQQAIINGGFTVNQRVYVSDATLSAGVYGHDKWKGGASGGDYTFTQLAKATTITIKSGKSLIQVVEDKNVIGGHYTLSWEGTAQARFGINSATPSSAYAASPITITTQTAGTVMSVEFNEGTLGKVVLNSGDVALPFMPKSFEEELRACQRYYEKSYSYATLPGTDVIPGRVNGCGVADGSGYADMVYPYKIPKRASVTPIFWKGTTANQCGYVSSSSGTINNPNGPFTNEKQLNARKAGGLTPGATCDFTFHFEVNAEL